MAGKKWSGPTFSDPYGPYSTPKGPTFSHPYVTPNYPVVTPPNLRTPAQPKKAETSWANWAPYFRGLGIYPRGNYLTATSPALRARLAPNALTAMQNYFSTSPRSWADYLTYAGRFMSRTPALSGRFWNPARWR